MVLAGPKVARLLPFLQAKGFNAEAFVKGGDTMVRLRAAPCHLLLFELECDDMMGVDLARAAKIERLAGAALLVDDPMKSGMIIAALSRGVDSYVALPPDETVFFERVEGLLLAQWGFVVQQQQQGLTDELAQLKQQLLVAESAASSTLKDTERALREQLKEQERRHATALKDVETKLSRATITGDSSLREMSDRFTQANRRVFELTREMGVLRDQLSTMHMVAGVKNGISDEGAPTSAHTPYSVDDDHGRDHGDDTDRRDARRSGRNTSAAPSAVRSAKTSPGPISGVGKSIGTDVTDDFQLEDLPGRKALTSDAFGDFDESTQAIPASLARSLLDNDAALSTHASSRAPARQISPPGALDVLSDFMPPTASFNGDDARARASSPLDLGGGALLEDLERIATSANSFGGGHSDLDAHTMAVPADLSFMARRQSHADDFNFDEQTPAGAGRAPPVPTSVRFGGNDDDTAPRGIEITGKTPPPPARSRDHLNSQLLKDASRIKSVGDEEVIFLDDD